MPCRDAQCRACPLWEQCETTCVPSVRYGGLPWATTVVAAPFAQQNIRALFIIGEAPGYQEDQAGLPWVGKAGGLLKKWIEYFHLTDAVDVYLSNAVRCRPPSHDTYGNRPPTRSQLKACQGFYLADILSLQKVYDEVIILTTGGPATLSVLGMSLKKSFTRQGDFTDFRALTAGTPKSFIRLGEVVGPYLKNPTTSPFSNPCRVFTTFHPAAILRDPNKGPTVHTHLTTLRDHLDGNLGYEIEAGTLKIQRAPLPPTYPITRLSLDIETYGILGGQNQTQFHPLKSVLYDNIRKEDLCVTTGLSWLNSSGNMEHAVFIMSESKDRKRLWSWIRKCSCHTNFEFLLGQNLRFDLMYLRFAYPECKAWLDYPLPLMDLIITNYLHDEGRPERSLKSLAPLLRVTKYSKPASFIQHPDSMSSSLWQYNCLDTSATLRCQKKLEKLIADLYGTESMKLTPFSQKWYSNLLWLTLWMEEQGIAMSVPQLQNLNDLYQKRLTRLEESIQHRWDIPFRGKGSDKAKRQIMKDAVRECQTSGITPPKLEKTKTRKEISFCEENRNALTDVLTPSSVSARQLRAVGYVHTVTGTLDRYLYPLLIGRGPQHKDPTTRLIDGIAYPRWYPVPSDWEDGSAGGTKQARIIAKGPPVQTFPKRIKTCTTSRHSPGFILWWDYSQIELRTAALLSNDPWMMAEYTKSDCDFHLATAHRLFGSETGKRFRQIGKTLNFLVIYLGGAKQYQTTLMRDEGIYRELHQCQSDIDSWWAGARGLAKWHEELFKFVAGDPDDPNDRGHGYFELPLVGQSRLFLGSTRQRRDSMKEIVNMPVQATAANITLSAQFELAAAFHKRHLKSVIPLNVYDAAMIDGPMGELGIVRKLVVEILPNPPYYRALCDELGRTLPLTYDVKIQRISA